MSLLHSGSTLERTMIVVKKYGNRRLYDTTSSSYINLEQLAGLIRTGEPVQVVDAKSGADLTHEVLLQVVLEVLRGSDLLPSPMLRLLIMATGDAPWHRALRGQLANGMRLFSDQLAQAEQLLRAQAATGMWPGMSGGFGGVNPFTSMGFGAPAGSRSPEPPPPAEPPPSPDTPPPAEPAHQDPPAGHSAPDSAVDPGLQALLQRLEALEKKLGE